MQRDVEEFLASSGYAAQTQRTYARLLAELVEQQGLESWSAADLIGYVERESWGNSRRRLALFACRSFLRWRYGVGHAALGARIKRLKSKKQRSLDAGTALQLLAMFDTSKDKGARDLAIAALFLDTGLRCSEMCRLKTADVDVEGRTLQVLAKGGIWRFAVFSPQTALYIAEWRAFRDRAGRFETLFLSMRTLHSLVPGGLNRIVGEWGRRLGIALSPHDLRRSFATLSTIFGAPTRVVQVAGGWSDVGMVERYTRTLEAAAISPYLPVTNLTRR